MNKICSSIKQSKRLIELGIDINTADMDYVPFVNDPTEYDCVINEWNNEHEEDWIPAWSLSALLELIPEKIPGTKLVIKWEGSYYIEGRDCLFDNAIDAAFEMVCWLKENNKL